MEGALRMHPGREHSGRTSSNRDFAECVGAVRTLESAKTLRPCCSIRKTRACLLISVASVDSATLKAALNAPPFRS